MTICKTGLDETNGNVKQAAYLPDHNFLSYYFSWDMLNAHKYVKTNQKHKSSDPVIIYSCTGMDERAVLMHSVHCNFVRQI